MKDRPFDILIATKCFWIQGLDILVYFFQFGSQGLVFIQIKSVFAFIGLDTEIFKKIVRLKNPNTAEDDEQLCDCFADYYKATRDLTRYVEKLAD